MPDPITPPHQRLAIKQVRDKIESQLVKQYREKLKLANLPAEVQEAIASAATTAAQRATRANLEGEALRVAKTFFQPGDVKDLISNKLMQAKAGVKLVSESADLNEILAENAKMLAAKLNALTATGVFSRDEAFQLILAEVQGKAARRGSS